MLRLSKKEFVLRAVEVHGNTYVLDRADYGGRRNNVEVGCRVHGYFFIRAGSFLAGHGCIKCAAIRRAEGLRKTTEAFIAESKVKFGDKFLYHKANYASRYTKLELVCSCGTEFLVAPVVHFSGNGGCPTCFKQGVAERTLVPFEEFIKRAREVHGGRYSYMEDTYKGSSGKLSIVCSEHGVFQQAAFSHLAGRGCKKCGIAARASSRLANGRAAADKKLSGLSASSGGSLYSYSKSVYAGCDSPIIITCDKHGDFSQLYGNHVRGHGCPKCAKERTGELLRFGFDDFLLRAVKVHGDKYHYDGRGFTSLQDRLNIVCKEHGEFSQVGASHLSGKGCPVCGVVKSGFSRRVGFEEFLERAARTHGSRYLYHAGGFNTVSGAVEITCKKHGAFSQYAQDHLDGSNCPRCAVQVSNHECEIRAFMEGFGRSVTASVVGLLGDRRELDLVVESALLAVEINGLRWHSERTGRGRHYHQSKTDAAAKAGYALIHITDLQWETRQEAVKSMLMARCGIEMEKFDARKCQIVAPTLQEMRDFLERSHIQGFRPSKEHYGLSCDNRLVAVASFGLSKAGEAELQRYATLPGVRVRGGLGRLVAHWRRLHPATDLISFCDTTYFDGRSYKAVGFVQEKVLGPDYGYTDGLSYYSKEAFRKAHLAKRFEDYDPELTERENAENNGWYRIWGCNKLKFRLPALQVSQPSPL